MIIYVWNLISAIPFCILFPICFCIFSVPFPLLLHFPWIIFSICLLNFFNFYSVFTLKFCFPGYHGVLINAAVSVIVVLCVMASRFLFCGYHEIWINLSEAKLVFLCLCAGIDSSLDQIDSVLFFDVLFSFCSCFYFWFSLLFITILKGFAPFFFWWRKAFKWNSFTIS